jgi:hypothetical protein
LQSFNNTEDDRKIDLKKRYEVKKKAPARKQLKLDANFKV